MRPVLTLIIPALVLILHPGKGGVAQDRGEHSWRDQATALFLALEPALVLTDDIRRVASEEAGSAAGDDAFPALLRSAEARVQTAPSPDSPEATSKLSAGAALESLGATRLQAVLLGVSLLRARGEDAVVALVTCHGQWRTPQDVTLGDLPAIAWRPRGGMYQLLPEGPGGPLAIPSCPWGQWLPLAPQAGAPQRIGPSAHVSTLHQVTRQGALPALNGLHDLLALLLANPGTRYPLHVTLRSSWVPDQGQHEETRVVRTVVAAGFVAATLTVGGGHATLAVDLRVHAGLQDAGQARIARLIEAVAALGNAIESQP